MFIYRGLSFSSCICTVRYCPRSGVLHGIFSVANGVDGPHATKRIGGHLAALFQCLGSNPDFQVPQSISKMLSIGNFHPSQGEGGCKSQLQPRLSFHFRVVIRVICFAYFSVDGALWTPGQFMPVQDCGCLSIFNLH